MDQRKKRKRCWQYLNMIYLWYTQYSDMYAHVYTSVLYVHICTCKQLHVQCLHGHTYACEHYRCVSTAVKLHAGQEFNKVIVTTIVLVIPAVNKSCSIASRSTESTRLLSTVQTSPVDYLVAGRLFHTILACVTDL